MLDPGTLADMRTGFELAIDTLGVPATWQQVQPPRAAASMTVGARLAGRNDPEVVNAIGHGGRILTAKADAFGPHQPAKFDTFAIGDRLYVANSVHEVLLNDQLIGWKIMAKAPS